MTRDMSAPPEDFETLQKILAVKRHEQPPPRFFQDFSSKVLDRLQEPESLEATTWWQRMGLDFDLKPAFVCAWGVAVCGSMVIGIISSVNHQETPLPFAELAPLRVGAPASPSASLRPDHWAATAPSVLDPTMTPLSQFTVLAQPVGFNFEFKGY